MDAAVELQHVFTACRLMKPINVLSDNGGKFPFLLKPCQCLVGGIWLLASSAIILSL